MRFLVVAVKLKIKELLNSKTYIVVLMLVPLLVGMIGIQGMKWMQAARLKSGLYFEKTTLLGQAMKEILVKDKEIQFQIYEDLEELEKAVAIGEIECGFSISKDIDEAVENMELEGIITLLKSPASIASGTIQEIVGAAIYRMIADEIAFSSLKNKDYMQGTVDLKQKVEQQVESYYKNGKLMQVEMVIGSGEVANHQKNKFLSVLQLGKGCIAIFLFMNSLLMGVKLTEERKSEGYKRFYTLKKKVRMLELPFVISHFILQFVVGGLSLILLKGTMWQYMEIQLGKEIMYLGLYIMSLNLLLLCMGLIIKESHIWFGITPVLSIACVIFCPIIIDFSSIQTPLKYICYLFVPYYYLKGRVDILMGIGVVGMVGYILIKKSYRCYR